MRKINPYCSRKLSTSYKVGGKSANKTFEPSSGGMGTKLKIASRILTKTIRLIIYRRGRVKYEPANLNIKAKIMAIKKLEAGPAAPTSAGPIL